MNGGSGKRVADRDLPCRIVLVRGRVRADRQEQ
jgi:hypothetical protein